jgi:uncharacterized membrane protein
MSQVVPGVSEAELGSGPRVSGKRLDAIDVARGLALIAMAAYHFTWDLAYFGLVAASTPFTPPMRLASHAIGATFLGLAGASLALAHARGFRLRAFLWRLARIGAAAALVTGASFAVAPEAPIGFGILHCIVVASLLAAPLLWDRGRPGRSRALAPLALGAVLVALPAFVALPLFDPPWLVWLGLGAETPSTLDWRPLMPWGGVVLLGLGLQRLAPPPFPNWRAKAAPARALAFAGRHSLAVYLLHQPLLIAALYAFVHLTGLAERQSVDAYLKACRPACVEAGGEIEACERACACVVRDASGAGLAGRLGAHALSSQERGRIGEIVASCGSQAQ